MNSSFQQKINKLKTRIFLKLALRKIDLKQFAQFQKKYQFESPAPGYSKYLDIEKYLALNLQEIFMLKLHHSKPLHILDIGSGCGYYPFLCQFLGHSVMAIDIDNTPMYNEIINFLKIKRMVWKIQAFEKLPNPGVKFDLITAFAVCFNNHNQSDLWGVDEWSFFLDDLTENYLSQLGRLYLKFNSEKNEQFMNGRLRDFFIHKGARVDGWKIYFPEVKQF